MRLGQLYLQTVWNWIVGHKTTLTKLISYSVLASIVLFYGWQLYQTGFDFEWQDYQINWKAMSLVFLLQAIGLGYGGLGWAVIMREVAGRNKLWKSVKVYYLTTITRNLPVIGVNFVARAYLHQEEGRGKLITVVAVLVEGLITMTVGGLVYLVVFFIFGQELAASLYYLAIIVVVVGLILLSPPVFKRLIHRVPRFSTQSDDIPYFSFHSLFYLLALYFFIVLLAGLIFSLIATSIYPISAVYAPRLIAVLALSFVVQFISSGLPGSTRLRDATVLVTLTGLTSPSAALIITFVWRYILLLNDFLWGFFALGILWLRGDELWKEAQSSLAKSFNSGKLKTFKKRFANLKNQKINQMDVKSVEEKI